MFKKYKFHVSGTHCASCKILIEDVLSEQTFVKTVSVDLGKEIVELEMENEQNAEELAEKLTDKNQNTGES